MQLNEKQESELNPPLTWKEARSRLKSLLQEYLDNPPTYFRKRDSHDLDAKISFGSRWLKRDIDIYCGAFGGSVALLVIACLTFSSSIDESLGARFRTSQLVAATLLFIGGIVNLWIVYRRNFSNYHGSDSLKRREILRFLREIEKQENEFANPSQNLPDSQESGPNLAGSSLTDIYPVYRKNYLHDKGGEGGSWSRIPTLLLVRGDHVALQVGDIAPAACRVIEGLGSSSSKMVKSGDTITLETFGETSSTVTGKLPRGRTTLPKDSDELLILCNHMKIFQLLESPLESFLRFPFVTSRKPQVFRQLERVRIALSTAGLSMFLLTAVVTLSRMHQDTSEVLILLPAPFLAALGLFPFSSPASIVFIEALGTARILASYHPLASVRPESPSGSANVDLLLFRYFLATVSNRLSLQDFSRKMHQFFTSLYQFVAGTEILASGPTLVRVPPVSLNLLEKLGVATAFTVVDDELICEPHAVPQQLLIPSGKGLKLLDICPTYDEESDDGGDSLSDFNKRMRGPSFDGDDQDSDSDSDDGFEHHHHMPSRRTRRRLLRKVQKEIQRDRSAESEASGNGSIDHEVQFEDPLWWQHLPSLKCIGLACLLVDQKDVEGQDLVGSDSNSIKEDQGSEMSCSYLKDCKSSLVQFISSERRTMQLRSLAQCIGFSTKLNDFGDKGDISPFAEKFRLLVVSTSRVRERLEIDSHERGSEESRWWGLLRPDSTSVIVQDLRSGAYQLLTVGDPRVVTRMCHQAWQGENSTILPLTAHDRATILETSNGWKLADLAVEAFSYAPIPHTFEQRLKDDLSKSKFYLLDNDPRGETLLPMQKDKASSGEWPLLHDQIFLGVLGSLIIPRQETQGLLSTLQDAGVRFVFMSPRNMRLTKEIASQMGIDVAWNCAISLRPLDQGEEDPHRMVSTYADWDVNAKLPHGIESVKRHLKEVDNVPLLVSLFTDVTKVTTMQMIETFQEYNDTVIAVGLSHLPWNSRIFSTADLAVGVDVLNDCLRRLRTEHSSYNSLLPSEISFISAISVHSCAFRLRGVTSIAYMPTILAHGRASLDAATSASIFLICGFLSFAFYVFFSVCSVATVPSFVPIMGAVMVLQVVLPLVGLTLTMSDPDKQCMQRVPPKNDPSITFGKKEGKTLFLVALFKALPPAVFPQLLYLIAFGEFAIYFEPDLVRSKCNPLVQQGDWSLVVRCEGLQGYSGIARSSAVAISLGGFLLCTIVVSAAFVHRTLPLYEEPPWRRNHVWVLSVVVGILVIAVYLELSVDKSIFWVLPWYFFVLGSLMPFLCLALAELLKKQERALLDRAEKLRRLQFETRLGMWSPK